MEISEEEISTTHVQGKRPVWRMNTTTGVEGVEATVLEWYAGVGGHITIMVDFKSAMITGEWFPVIVAPSARLLNSNSDRIRRQYDKVLEDLCERHRMFETLLLI